MADNGDKKDCMEMKVQSGEQNQLLPMDDNEDVGDFQADSSYTRKKTMAKGCLDFALLMANTSQLKTLLASGKKTDLYYQLIGMIILSIVMQVVVGVVLIILGASEPRTRKGHRYVEHLNNTSVILILLITVLNLFISSLGISGSH